MSLEDQDGWSHTYEPDELLGMIDGGHFPMFVQTDRNVGLYVVDPAPNSQLQSEDKEVRRERMVACMVIAGALMDAEAEAA